MSCNRAVSSSAQKLDDRPHIDKDENDTGLVFKAFASSHTTSTSRVVRPLSNASNTKLFASFSEASPRPLPNSAKKRRPLPDLSRLEPSPGHGEKMSAIFRGASAELQTMPSPSGRPCSNLRTPRPPLSPIRNARFGISSEDDTAISYLSPSQNKKGRPVNPQSTEPKTAHAPSNSLEIGTETYSRTDIVKAIDDPGPQESNCLPDARSRKSPVLSTLPVIQPHSSYLGSEEEEEPMSSGFTSPSGLNDHPVQTPGEIKYPEFKHWHLPLSPSPEGSFPSCSRQEFGSGPPVSFEPQVFGPSARETQSTPVTAWLDALPKLNERNNPGSIQKRIHNVRKLSRRRATPSPKERPAANTREISNKIEEETNKRAPSGASSNKENISPCRLAASPRRPPVSHQNTTPSGSRKLGNHTSTRPSAALPFDYPLTSPRFLNLPPKRRKPRVGGDEELEPSKTGQDFTIHDDQVASALAQLSPDVQLHRKGRGPKRERCISYWDEDMFPPDLPCLSAKDSVGVHMRKGKAVLGESGHTSALTKSTPFTGKAEGASFDFQIS